MKQSCREILSVFNLNVKKILDCPTANTDRAASSTVKKLAEYSEHMTVMEHIRHVTLICREQHHGGKSAAYWLYA